MSTGRCLFRVVAAAVLLLALARPGISEIIIIDDPPGGGGGPQFSIIASPSSLTTDKMGATETLRVRLACNYAPCLTAVVQVLVRSDSPSQGWVRVPGGAWSSSVTLAFQQGNYETDQIVEVQGRDDGLQNGDTPYTVTLQASSSDARINGLSRSVPAVNVDRTDHNVCLPNVVDSFRALPSVLEKLPVLAQIPPMGGYTCPAPENTVDLFCRNHFQGAQRLKHGPYFMVTGNGPDASEFFISHLTAKQGLTGRWGNNFTTWDNDYQVNYPTFYQLSWSYPHAGGFSVFGDFAVIPLEGGGPGSVVWFLDVFDPARPLILNHATLPRFVYDKAGAASVTKVNGRYLVAVQSDEPAEIQFYLSSTGDIRDPQTWSLLGAWSTQQHGYGNPQNINFFEQCDGTVFLVVSSNSGDGANTGAGDNYARLFRVDTAAILGGNGNNSLTEMAYKTFSCATEYLHYCNFDAGAGLYVSPSTRQLMLYSTWFYHEILYTSTGWHGFILAGEYADEDNPAGHTTLVPRQARQGIRDGQLIIGQQGPDVCVWPMRCDIDATNSLAPRSVLLSDIHYLRVQFQPNGAWNAPLPAPWAQVDDNVRARPGSGGYPYVFDVYPSPNGDPDHGGAPYFGTLRFVEQDDQGDNFGSPWYDGWPRSWKDWKQECSLRADGDEDKNGVGIRFWASGTDVSAGSTAILRDVGVCIVDDSPGDISPAWRVTLKRKSQNLPPGLDPIGNRSVAEGSTLTFAIHGTDTNDDTVTYTASGMPAGATLNAVTGVFTWAPGYAQEGTYTITFSASDGLAQAIQTALITVTHTDVAPVLSPIGNRTAYKGTQFNLQLYATDPDPGPLTYSSSALPPGAELDPGTGRMTWLLSGTGTYASSYTVTFRVTDPTGLSDSETIIIYVRTLSCLLAGTPIEMADGSLRPIEQIHEGDEVRSYDGETGEFTASGVSAVMTASSAMHLVINGRLRLTDKHPLRANGGWVEAGELKVGDVILTGGGELEIVRSIDLVEREEPVFNIEVEGTHTYVAGGLVVHNKPPVEGGGSQTGQ